MCRTVILEDWLLFYILAFHVEEKRDKGGPIQLLLPFDKPHDWLVRGSRRAQKEWRIVNEIGYMLFGPLLKRRVLHPAEVLALTPKWQGRDAPLPL